MTDHHEHLSDAEIGERLRISRESAKKTQAEAADAIAISRTTLVAIEQGLRRIKIDEIQRLASIYGTSVNAILRREAIHLDMIPRFRRLSQAVDNDIEMAAHELNVLVRAEVELENTLGIRRSRNYPPERPLLPGDVRAQAEQDAEDLRSWLGLGPGPILDILSILDLQIGVRVYLRKLPAKISGLFAYDDAVGACILLNASHPIDRIAQTSSHELGHFVSTRKKPEALLDNEKFSSREERYANFFSRSFLTPARAVRQRFAEITAGQSHLTRRHIILLAHAFGVSREALTRRLEELGLARKGTWDWFVGNGGITDEQEHQVLGARSSARQPQASAHHMPLPPRLTLLVREAWKRELYSEGQLGRLLELDRITIRMILDGAEDEESEANELFKLS